MSIDVKVPQLPESVADATLVSWHKSAGDSVERDENLVDLETDKVVLEVPAPVSGVLKEIKIKDGTTVTSGELLAVLEEGEAKAGKKSDEKPKAQEEDSSRKEDEDRESPEPQPERKPDRERSTAKLSPSVRHLIEEHDLDPDRIEGSGRDGRLTKADVISFIERKQQGSGREPKQSTREERKEPTAPAGEGSRHEERVAMTRLRSRIAERMVQAQSEAAMLTSFNEVDLGEIMALRGRHKERFEKTHRVRLGLMSFFVKAAIAALKQYPVVNASIDGSDVVYHDYHDIGIAVSTERGLMVPILRDAGRMSFADVERSINEYAAKAREGTIGLDDLTGGTFTITNGGVFGSLMSTPILNPPQSAILGMHKIQDRPVIVDKTIEIRPMMYIALTYDHRIIDGREAVLFLVAIKAALEDPARLLIGI
ncbi:2-oxoglutarate dehydrogenase complex dihydrolipoyllysine-residue succinyltransferase [soil metagenome]